MVYPPDLESSLEAKAGTGLNHPEGSSLGDKLIAYRVALGVSQQELARALGISETQVARDERNRYRGISIRTARRVVEAFLVMRPLPARLEANLRATLERLRA